MPSSSHIPHALFLTSIVPSSFLEGKTFPPEAAPTVQEPSKVGEQKRQHDEEQSRQEIENVLRGFYPRAPSPTGSGR